MKSKKLFSALFISLALVLFPSIVKADEVNVAKIGETEYATFEDAIDAAKNGDTIELLADVKATKTFYKSLTFTGGHTLYMDVYGWRYNGDLVFDGANLSISSGENSLVANNAEAGKWFTMVLSGSITAKNGANITFTFDSKYGVNCAIYTGSRGVTINVDNDSKFHIYGKNTKGVSGQGIQLDSTANTGIFVTNESEFLIDGTNRGYVNSPTVYVEDSTLTVQNCTSNGSNGGKFTAINSNINFLNNAGLGLSAGSVNSTNSVFKLNDNGMSGLVISSVDLNSKFDKASKVYIENNGANIYGAFAVAANVTFEAGSSLKVLNNETVGIRVLDGILSWIGSSTGKGTLDVEEGAFIEVTNNINNKEIYTSRVPASYSGSTFGGGIWANGTVKLPSNAIIYNNHALSAGDDIYVEETGKIILGSVGEDWKLDGEPDCYDSEKDEYLIDRINGWYEDGYTNEDSNSPRWQAHSDDKENHIIVYSAGEYSGIALKAAHDRGTVVIKYVDEEGNEIVDSVMLNPGISGDTFETSALDLTNKNYKFDKYVYETDLENTDYKITTEVDEVTGKNIEIGEYIFGNVTITYMYHKVGYLEVYFVDEDGNEIASTQRFSEKVGSDYQTYPNQILDYELINHEGEETGKYKDGTIIVKYIYTYIGGIGDVEEPDIIVPPHTDAEVSINANSLMFMVEAEDKKRRN